MTVEEAVEQYRYAKLRLQPTTQVWYAEKLATFSDWCAREKLALSDLNPHAIRRFIEQVASRTNPQTGKPISSYTVHGYAQVVKGFVNFCMKDDLPVSETLHKRIEMPPVKKKVIEIFTPEQQAAMFNACASKRYAWMGGRDKAILALLFDTGIRSAELLSLTLDNVHLDPYDAYIKVTGKGDKEREVGLGNRSRQALHKYITRYRKADPKERHVFIGRQGPMLKGGLDELFERLQEKAHIIGVRCSPHTCRHTFAVQYLRGGGTIFKLSKILGHSSVTVTEIYLNAFNMKEVRGEVFPVDRLSF